jgi:hypothetical protein
MQSTHTIPGPLTIYENAFGASPPLHPRFVGSQSINCCSDRDTRLPEAIACAASIAPVELNDLCGQETKIKNMSNNSNHPGDIIDEQHAREYENDEFV